MKNGIMTHHEYYVLKIDGRVNSTHRRFLDALRAGLHLKDQLPQHDIKVGVVHDSSKEVMPRSASH